jgi:hypothetical protein
MGKWVGLFRPFSVIDRRRSGAEWKRRGNEVGIRVRNETGGGRRGREVGVISACTASALMGDA